MPSSTGLAQQSIGSQTFNEAVLTGCEFNALTAHAGGGQANATPIIDGCAEVHVVATSGDSVKLPPAAAGIIRLVSNTGANPMQVFGNGIDTINDQTYTTGVSVASQKSALFFCIKASQNANGVSAAVAGEWYMVLSA